MIGGITFQKKVVLCEFMRNLESSSLPSMHPLLVQKRKEPRRVLLELDD